MGKCLRRRWSHVGSHGTCTTTKKKNAGENRACAEHTSGQDHFRKSRDPTRADIAQLPVAHAHNIIPVTSLSVMAGDVTFGYGR
jgi:hypothetical protein